MSEQLKAVEVEYIESGTFQGSEESVFMAGIKHNEDCVVLKKSDYERLTRAAQPENEKEGNDAA